MSGREGVNSCAGDALERKKNNRDACHLRHNICQPAVLIADATPPHRQNQLDVALFASDRLSETADYTDGCELCQAEEC